MWMGPDLITDENAAYIDQVHFITTLIESSVLDEVKESYYGINDFLLWLALAVSCFIAVSVLKYYLPVLIFH